MSLTQSIVNTPERDLAKAKVALRLRRDGEDVIQTLKTRGESVAGLSVRNEYDWHLPKAKLDDQKLDGECWPEALMAWTKRPLNRFSPLISCASALKSPGTAAKPKW